MPFLTRVAAFSAHLFLGATLLSCDSPTEAGVRIPAALQIVDGNEQEGEVGLELDGPLIVRVVDDADRPIQGVLVNFVVVSGGGSVFAGSGLTNVEGLVQERWTLGTEAGEEQRVEARAVDSQSGEPIVFATFRAVARPGPPAELVKTAGDGLQLAVGSTVTPPPAVRVEDRFDNPIEDVVVAFTVTTAGANTHAGTITSDAEGIARVSAWTLSTTAGVNTMTAAADGVPMVTFTNEGVAGAAGRVTMVTQPSATAVVGVPLSPQPAVRLVDEYGNAVAQAATFVTVEIATGGGTLTGSTTVQTDANGIATFTSVAIIGIAGPRTLRFSVGGLESATSQEIQVGTGLPASITKYAGDQVTVLAGTAVPVPPAVIVTDAGGNPVSGVHVAFELIQGGGSVEPAMVATNGDGIASLMRWTLGTTPGENQVRATLANVGSVTFTATGTQFAGPRMLVHAGDDQEGIVGRLVAVPPTVRVVDADGRGIAGVAVTFAGTSGNGSVTDPVMSTTRDGFAWVGSWRLGPIPGENTLTATAKGYDPVVFSATALPDITITIHQPSSQWVSGGTVIEVQVESPNAITSVVAAIADRSTSLTFDIATRRWKGGIVLDGLPTGLHELVVTATDANGYTAVARKAVNHNSSPTLTVTAPMSESAARPTIRVQATCADQEAPCARLLVRHQATKQVFAEGTTELDAEIDLSGYDGSRLVLEFVAEDAAALVVSAARVVYVESSTLLREIAAAPAVIRDADAERSLYLARDASGAWRLGILHHASGTTSAVPWNLHGPPLWAELTPRGAMFTDGPLTYDLSLYEYADGILTNLGSVTGAQQLLVEGPYALWMSEGSLYRRDILTGATMPIGSAINNSNDLAPNGDVVFWRENPTQVYRYRDGVITRLTSDPSFRAWTPITDGTNVIFVKSPACCTGDYRIAMHDGASERVLTEPFDFPQPAPGAQYHANGGWVSYLRWGTSSSPQTWTRSPSGEERLAVQHTGSSGGSRALGPNGEVIVSGHLYEAPYSSAPIEFATSSSWGRAFFIGSTLYYRLGRHLFEVVR